MKRAPLLPSLRFVNNAALFSVNEGFKYGDFYKLTLPGHKIWVVAKPDVIQQITVSKKQFYTKSKIYWKELKKIIGDGLGTLEGEEWMILRQSQQQFFTPAKVQEYLPGMAKLISAYIHKLKNTSIKGETDLVHLLAAVNTEVILKQVFGVYDEVDYGKIASSIADGEATIAWRSKYPWRPFLANFTGANQRAKKHLLYFDGLTKAFTESEKTTKNGMLKHLLSSLHIRVGVEMLRGIRNELIVYLGASTETLAVAEGWTLYLLWKHPEILQKVKQEIKEVTLGESLDYTHINRLIYTKAVVEESLRLYPPSYGIVRDCLADDTLDGKPVKKDDTLFINTYALHRHPGLWQNANKFDPNRFLGKKREEIPAYNYLPFGAGMHTCIGRFLATPQLIFTVAAMIQNFDIEFITKSEILPESLSTLKPKGGFKVILH